MDDLRKTRKEIGLCVQCGAKLDREGIMCIRCNRMNNSSKIAIVKELHVEGKCSTCRKPLDRGGWFCKECASKLKLRARNRSAERRERGLCVQCGNPSDGYSQCRSCLDKLKERRSRKK